MEPSAESLSGLRRLLDVVARLRGENGCPWDREQTLASLKPSLVEECYEVIDAIDGDDAAKHAEELGDLLLQIAMQAQIRSESGSFSFDDVAHAIADKLIRRHPHVFGDVQVSGSEDVLKNWEKIKAVERAPEKKSLLDGVPRHLPALQKAQRVQSRAARVGFDWDDIRDVFAKVEEELREVKAAGDDPPHVREEIGDLLFAAVNLSRFHNVSAEDALQSSVAKFARRFHAVENRVWAEGKQVQDCTLAELDAHWNAVKKEEAVG